MTILMLGQHLELGYYRSEFLKSHGFEVIFPESKTAALAAIRMGGFDAVVISYTLSKESAKEFVTLIKQAYKDCPIIAITQKQRNEDGLEPDELVLDTDRPAALLDALVRIEKRRQSICRVK